MIEVAILWLPTAYLLAVMVPIIRANFLFGKLPNRYVLPGYLVTLAAYLVEAILSTKWLSFWSALGSLVVVFAIGLVLNLRNAVGMGDAKLGGLFAFVIGWWSWWLPLLLWPLVIVVLLATHYLVINRTHPLARSQAVSYPTGLPLFVVFTILLTLAQ